MMIKSISVNNKSFNVAQAPAIEQKRLMLLLGGKILFNSTSSNVESIDTNFLVGTLLTLPEDTFDKIASIVLYKTFLQGAENNIDIGNFQGSMVEYFTLVAQAIAYNLDDYFTWLDDVRAVSRASKLVETKNI